MFGDLAAQVSSGRAGGERLIALCQRQGLQDIEAVSDEIISRSEAATREAIRALPAGTWHGESRFDVPGGDVITLKAAVTIDNNAGEVTIDFDGSSGRQPDGHQRGDELHPRLFDLRGAQLPQSRAAEQLRLAGADQGDARRKGSIVNAAYPSPLNARHVVGMFVPMPILKALHQVMPDRVLAEGSGAVWTVQIQGKRANGEAFTSSMFNYSGGMGARLTKPGPSATCYPTGVAAVPVEILEASMPIVFDRRELRPGSGGKGRSRGGDGQMIGFHMRTDQPWLLNAVPSRLDAGPGGPGRRRHRRGRPLPGQRQADVGSQEDDDGSPATSWCWRPPAAAATARSERQDERRAMDIHAIDWNADALGARCAKGVERKAFSGDGATVSLNRLQPGHEPRPHDHPHEQIVYILQRPDRLPHRRDGDPPRPRRPAGGAAERAALGRGGRRRAGAQPRRLHAQARRIRQPEPHANGKPNR